MSVSKSLFKATSLVSLITLLSRLLGFIRDMLLASLFGATAGLDAFLVAFKIPNLMRGLFAEGGFSHTFVPLFAEYRGRNEKELLQFISRSVGFLIVILSFFTIVAEILAPLIALIFAPGFVHDIVRYTMTLHMLHITLFYLLLMSLTAFYGALLNSYDVFSIPSFTPVLLNFVMIIAAIYLAPKFSIPEVALAWGVLGAGIIQLLFQLPFLYKRGLLIKPRWGWKDEGVRRALKLMVPALFGVSVVQIGLLINTFFASFLSKGSISWLYYSDRLTFFPLGVFGVALATVVLPYLSKQYTNNSREDFIIGLDWALRLMLIISIPAGLGLFIMSGAIITTLFYHGEFSLHDVLMTQKSVMAFALGLPAFTAVKVLSCGFYSRQDLQSPVRIAVVATISNVVLSLGLIFPLAHMGLALATSISSLINTLLLYIVLLRKGIYRPLPGWRKYLLQLLFANSLMMGVLVLASPSLQQWLNWSWHQRVMNLGIWLIIAIFVYFSCLWLCGMRIRDFRINKYNEMQQGIINYNSSRLQS